MEHATSPSYTSTPEEYDSLYSSSEPATFFHDISCGFGAKLDQSAFPSPVGEQATPCCCPLWLCPYVAFFLLRAVPIITLLAISLPFPSTFSFSCSTTSTSQQIGFLHQVGRWLPSRMLSLLSAASCTMPIRFYRRRELCY